MEKYIIKVNIDNADINAALFLLDKSKNKGTLEYFKDYLSHEKAFPLDPYNLNFNQIQYTTMANKGYFGFLHDMLPHGWNRKMLEFFGRTLLLNKYIVSNSFIKIDNYSPQKLYLDLDNDFDALAQYQKNVTRMENGEVMKGDIIISPIGGVRPKVLVKYNKDFWIAKFESQNDKYNNPLVEYAMLNLAKKCGLNTPDVLLLSVDNKSVFLTKHFALNHIVLSAGTVLNMDWNTDNRFYNYYNLYQKTGSNEIFKRIAFNIFTKNMDDHPWNHSFLYDGKNVMMSPFYDAMPFTDEFCLLHGEFGKYKEEGTIENLYSAVNAFNTTEDSIKAIKKNVQGWRNIFLSCGVSERDCDFVKNAFSVACKVEEQ